VEVYEFNFTSSQSDVTGTALEVKINLFGSLGREKGLTYIYIWYIV
jgi:hypothetical protein